MAITTYAELLTAVADWSHRSDLTSVIPDFVTLAEARINDALTIKTMETETTLTGTIGVDYIALPAGFVSPIAMWVIVDSYRNPLTAALPQDFDGGPTNSIPEYFAIDGVNVLFDCHLSAAYTFPLRYIKQSNLSASNTTNDVLTKRPDIYLAGAMAECGRYTRDAEMFSTWEPKFLAALQAHKATDARNKSISRLSTELSGSPRSNIFAGE